MGSRSRAAAVTALCLLFCSAALADKPDEAALLNLWEKQKQDPENHTAIIQAADVFERTFASSPLVVVARGLAAWHQLKAGDFQEAQRTLDTLASGGVSPLSSAGRDMAFSWLTRMDMRAVKEGLRRVFAENIEYPDTLAPLGNLPANVRPPMTDRWGTPWAYHPGEFKQIKAGDKSSFVLQSTKLGDTSDFERALARPYGGGEVLTLTTMPPMNGKALLKISGTGGSQILVSEGAVAGRMSFPYSGDAILVLCNGDYWFIEKKQQN
jgi:hypothetical protein